MSYGFPTKRAMRVAIAIVEHGLQGDDINFANNEYVVFDETLLANLNWRPTNLREAFDALEECGAAEVGRMHNGLGWRLVTRTSHPMWAMLEVRS